MSRYTAVRGNPETKLMVINTNFSGGVNLVFSDDLVQDNEMRYLLNYELDNTGELRVRKGFSEVNALSELIYADVTTIEDFPIILKEASLIKNIILFRIIQNDNNAWKDLTQFSSLSEYQVYRGASENTIRLFIVAELSDDSVKYWDNSYTIKTSEVTKTSSTGTLPFAFSGEDNLVNVPTGEQYGKIYFTSNDSGLVMYNTESKTFSYVGSFTGETNGAYKPNGIEVRKVGFNVLGDNPLTWIDNGGLTVESIQGVYLTTTDRIPLASVPTGATIQINVIYTGGDYAAPGDYNLFNFVFSEYESPIDASVTYNATLSMEGIAVYDVDFLTKPVNEVQINIAFSEPTVYLEDYIDYYQVGAYDTASKAVDTLDIGGYKIIQMYDRLVYYNGNEVWFSDINNFEYVPNFNYILLPIDPDDEIVKIIFFRTSYILFTKKKIFKLEGSFESSTLNLSLVNDNVGCIAPESVVLVENVLFFLSTRGLRGLKTDTFRENLENMVEFDQKVYPIMPTHNKTYAFVYKDQYFMITNNRDDVTNMSVRGRTYQVPDVIKYYYRTGAFAFDKYNTNNYPRFIIFEQGDMYSLMDNIVARYGQGYDDFGEQYNAIFETAGVNMGYPTHEKKFKHVIFKLGGEVNTVYAETYSDGYFVQEAEIEPEYRETSEDLQSAKYSINKERLPSRGRNMAVKVTVMGAKELVLQSLAYLFKLGKVRDH